MIEFRTLGTLDLRGPDGSELRAVLTRPKRLALLAYLAASPPRFQRRDTLLALFWPELDREHARAALRKAVHELRRALGEDVLVGRRSDEVGLDRGKLWCDAAALEQAIDRGAPAEALALYRGHFLEGFYVSEVSPEFEHWVDAQRTRLRDRAAAAARQLAGGRAERGDTAGATEWARRALALSPNDEGTLRRVIALLDRAGDRAGAVREYEAFAHRLAADYEVEPSAETKAVVEAIRARETPRTANGDAAPRGAQPGGLRNRDVVATVHSRPVASRQPRLLRTALPGAIVLALGIGATALALRPRGPAAPVVAVGSIRDYGAADVAGLARPVADMLATNLARVPGLRVVSTPRLYEVLGQAGDPNLSAAAIERAAKRAGAREVVEGVLYHRPGGILRFDVRRVDLATGTVRAAYTVEGADAFALVDRATSRLAASFDARADTLRVADVTTESLVAYRLYEEGLRAYYQQADSRSAHRLFTAALAEDSTFAMAAWYAWQTALQLGLPQSLALLAHAVRLSDRASDRERLLIRTAWNSAYGEPAALAFAETLATRYPGEPDGHYWLAQLKTEGGDFLGALPHLRRVVALDSLSLGGASPRCRACDAMRLIAGAYMLADSFPAADRASREFVRLQPQSATAWAMLGGVLEYWGWYDEALSAYGSADRLLPPPPQDVSVRRAVIAMRADEFAEADRLLAPLLRDSLSSVRGEALWYMVVSYRYQGRLSEALEMARRHRRSSLTDSALAVGAPAAGPVTGALLEAQVRFELGNGLRAAAIFDSIADHPPFDPAYRGKRARHRVWMLTHVATALAVAGDTARLPALADSIERMGPESAYGRDRLLHHHVRGLLLLARGRPAEAEREFRRAIFSPTQGYTRTNLELGRVLLALHRPREAVAVLQPSLRGPLQASNLYVTHTELHELLARAFDEAGLRDSAAVHYRWVVDAWEHADPPLRARRDGARHRLAALSPS